MLLHLVSQHAFSCRDVVVYGEVEEKEAAWSREGQTWSVLREVNCHKPLLKLPVCVSLRQGNMPGAKGACACVCWINLLVLEPGRGGWGEGFQTSTYIGIVRWPVMDTARQRGFPLFVWERRVTASHTRRERSLSPGEIFWEYVCGMRQ